MLTRRAARRGAVSVEAAVVYPVLFLMILAILLLGLTVFRYQQLAHVAREASRWASVHGDQFEDELGQAAATQDTILNDIVLPQLGMSSGTTVSCVVTWDRNNKATHTAVVVDPVTGLSKVVSVSNTVSVTVSYNWNAGPFGVIPLSSTSVNSMSY
jgi:Flp pilus assembly protein TadG